MKGPGRSRLGPKMILFPQMGQRWQSRALLMINTIAMSKERPINKSFPG